MSSPETADDEAALDDTDSTVSRSDQSATGETSADETRRFTRSMAPSPSPSLPTYNHETFQEPPYENLHDQFSQSPGGTPETTSNYFAATGDLYYSPSPTWDKQCECGGVSPHYHNRGWLHDKMNGTHPPTGPRGGGARRDDNVQATNKATPPSPATTSPATEGTPKRVGQMPNHVQVAKSYVFQQEIEKCLRDNGVTQAREDNIRLAGVLWIDNVRRALKLPVRTFNTAVVYYHKFRLQHSDGEYSFVDASAAALFAACKIEDTLKKSRDILCAAHNLKAPRNEQLSPDDQHFEQPSRTIIGLERLMLEASGFDFRNRHPQDFLIKLLKHYSFERTAPVTRLAYTMSLDLYRTWAPLKQTTAAMAYACLELSGRLLGEEHERIWQGKDYEEWRVERGMVMETLLDLLELYTHHRAQTAIGPDFPLDRFLEVRIPLNVESEEKKIPRFSAWEETKGGDESLNGSAGMNGSKKNVVSPRDVTSPRRGGGAAAAAAGGNHSLAGEARTASGGAAGVRQRAGERGRDGTVRFILNPDRERDEKAVVEEYRKA